ncbi:MAG: hypothetical protein F6J89_21275 [Symploca sp. SIO1C4]|uniref:Uncharacterized protein n=1 Tax=Symploca sp. SIO1C4 TaxID=2607765 RepID=A0A6B3NEQ2_9CYAN|nr:hypothetical protein [Symploca sp. SIO1C4]
MLLLILKTSAVLGLSVLACYSVAQSQRKMTYQATTGQYQSQPALVRRGNPNGTLLMLHSLVSGSTALVLLNSLVDDMQPGKTARQGEGTPQPSSYAPTQAVQSVQQTPAPHPQSVSQTTSMTDLPEDTQKAQGWHEQPFASSSLAEEGEETPDTPDAGVGTVHVTAVQPDSVQDSAAVVQAGQAPQVQLLVPAKIGNTPLSEEEFMNSLGV